MQHTDEELTLTVNGRERKALVRAPERVTPGGVLCLELALDRAFTLDNLPYNIISDIFLAAGHRVASVDMPQHGELADEYGEGLVGIASAVRAGIDIFADFAAAARELVDACIALKWAKAGRVVVTGTSRGGHASLVVMAGDARVLACAAIAPVTYLPAVREFADQADNPIIRRWNANALIPHLADRHVFLNIGEEDPRVSAGHCFDFHARLTAASRNITPVLYTLPGATHGPAFLEPGYHAAAAFLLARCADAIKGDAVPPEL
ncbi:MAG: alpha/beta hydrolase family protein [Armatimonadota bacterium]